MTTHALPGTRRPDTAITVHRSIGMHRCTCGWEGDVYLTHLADLRRRQGDERIHLLRDALGRASYERMAAGFAAAGMPLDGWDDLRESVREAYRAPMDYVLPRLLEALAADALLGGAL